MSRPQPGRGALPSGSRPAALACALTLALACSLRGRPAAANPKPLAFSYPYETLNEGTSEVEQYVDMSVVRTDNPNGNPRTVIQPIYRFQSEFEYGITDRLELGLYVLFQPVAPDYGTLTPLFPGGNGIKQRLRYRLGDQGDLPVDIALYGEVAQLHNEIEIEAKVILQRRVGPARFIVNLWAEREYYYNGQKEWVLHPTAGATFQVTPAFHAGLEWWMVAEYLDGAALTKQAQQPFNLGPHQFVGPSVLLNFGKLWVNTGVYYRATNADRAMVVGDLYGHVWARTIIGLSL
jgi:hypothetical protein